VPSSVASMQAQIVGLASLKLVQQTLEHGGTKRQKGWISSPARGENFLFTVSSRPILGSTHCPTRNVPWAPSWLKRLDHETHHSPPTSAQVKKTCIYTSTPPHVFMAYLVMYRNNFTFAFPASHTECYGVLSEPIRSILCKWIKVINHPQIFLA
jgi:hypothetical protein